MKRELFGYGMQCLFWLGLVVYGYHLEVRFFAAAMTGYNAERFMETWRRMEKVND